MSQKAGGFEVTSTNCFLGILYTAQEKKFSIKDFFSKCNQNPQFPGNWVIFTEKILMENLIFGAMA